MAKVPMVCRVCGMEFTAPRWDAKTCTDTCRQRLRRGGEFAYFAGLSKREQRLSRASHDAYDALKAAQRDVTATTRAARDARRAVRAERARLRMEAERERFIAEITGRAYLAEQKRKREQGTLASVAGVLKLFAQERRNDMSAEAMAEFLAMPDSYPVESIAQALDQLRASGDYDQIVNEATSLPSAPYTADAD